MSEVSQSDFSDSRPCGFKHGDLLPDEPELSQPEQSNSRAGWLCPACGAGMHPAKLLKGYAGRWGCIGLPARALMWLSPPPATYPFLGGPSDGGEGIFAGGKLPGSDGLYRWEGERSCYVWYPVRMCRECGAEIFVSAVVACPLCGGLAAP